MPGAERERFRVRMWRSANKVSFVDTPEWGTLRLLIVQLCNDSTWVCRLRAFLMKCVVLEYTYIDSLAIFRNYTLYLTYTFKYCKRYSNI